MSTLFGYIAQSQSSASYLPLQTITERTANADEVQRNINDAVSAKIRVAIPAQVVSFNAAQQTIVAQPLIREKIIDRTTGNVSFMTIAQILDVPVMFPQAGNFVLTMPITPGDEVMLVFQDLCMDSWWTSGGIQNWGDRRRHDLSDAIAIPGINSVPNVIQNIATNAAELRSKDGQTRVTVKGAEVDITTGSSVVTVKNNEIDLTVGSSVVTVKSGEIDLNATNININGNLIHNGFNYLHHTHAGVQTGPGSTGPVVEAI